MAPASASHEDSAPPRTPSAPHRTGALATLEWIVARVLFPTVVGLSIAYAIREIEAGVDPGLAVGLPTILAYFVIGGFERLFYWQRDWLRSHDDVRVDLGHLVVSGLLTVQLLEVPVRLGAIFLATWLAGQVGGSIWPNEWNLWLQLLLALVYGEFFMYWVHRLTHMHDLLWRFHAMHHSAPRLYFMNAVRFHPVDLAISNFAPMVPLIVIGADARVIALFGLFSAVHGLFQHANIVIRLGPFNWFFSMAELHRWHHSRHLEESNTNFGQNLILWDIVFGTRFLPKDREPPSDIGLAGLPSFPMTYWAQIMSPFQWKKIREESAEMGAGPTLLSER